MTWLWHGDDRDRWRVQGCVISGLDSLTYTASLGEWPIGEGPGSSIARIAQGVVET